MGKITGIDQTQLAFMLQSGFSPESYPVRDIVVRENLTLINVNIPNTVGTLLFQNGREYSIVTFRTFPDMLAAGDCFYLSPYSPVVKHRSIPLARQGNTTSEITQIVAPNESWYGVSVGNLGDITVISRKVEWIKSDPRFQKQLMDTEIKRH